MERKEKETKRKAKKMFLIAAIAAVLLIAATGSASALCSPPQPGVCEGCCNTTHCYQCNDDVMSSCEFNADMTCYVCGPKYGNAEYGLKVGADGITIDGSGHALTGNVTGNHCDGIDEGNPGNGCCGIYDYGFDGLTIKNLEISNFCNGIGLDAYHYPWSGWLHDVTIESCDIHLNGVATPAWSVSHGIHAAEFRNSTVINNTIHHNTGTGDGCGSGGNGMFVYGTNYNPNYLLIHNNTFNDNRKSGFFTKMQMRNSTVSNNTACGNGFGNCHECAGINFRCVHTSYNVVEYNNCSWNNGSGIYIGGQYNDVRNNTASNNTCQGIFLGRNGGSAYNNLTYNDVWDNRDNGIEIVDSVGDHNTLYYNTVCRNAGKDIWDWDSNTGDYNTCDTAVGWCENLICPPPCTYQCGCNGSNLVVQDMYEEWNNRGQYYINYTVCNVGNRAVGSVSWTGIYINTTFQEHVQASDLAAFSCDPEKRVGPYSTTGMDTIKVCADYLGQITETKETDNCTENVFGGPDLVIRDCESGFTWVDEPYKRYNLTYRIENVGDVATPAQSWVNITCLDAVGGWNCTDPVPVPAGLPPYGGYVIHEVGPFVMGGNADWLMEFANFNKTAGDSFEENVWGDIHGQYDKFMPSYGTTCNICGDVTGEGLSNAYDGKIVAGAVPGGSIATCWWAADVNCNHLINPYDGKIIAGAVPGVSKNCCAPGPI